MEINHKNLKIAYNFLSLIEEMSYLKTAFFLFFLFICFCGPFSKRIYAQDIYSIQNRDISYMTSGGKLNPLQKIMDIRHYTFKLIVEIEQKRIDGEVEIQLILSKPTDTLLLDLIHLMVVSEVRVNNQNVNFSQGQDKIFITSNHKFASGLQKILVKYGGVPPVAIRPPWGGGFTWSKDTSGNPWVVINCQSEGGKIFFPCKDHPSDEPNEGVDMFITVPRGLTVAGPGLLEKISYKGNQSTFHWKTRYTISNYCMVFNVAKYKVVQDSYTTILGHKVPIEYFILDQDSAQAQKVIQTRKRDTRILEKYLGEYPWVKEKIGIAEVPNPGMEHQTMITFPAWFNFATVGGQLYSSNLFHEFAHEWFANKVTNQDWAHMWIQEGITTFNEALCMYELGGQSAYDEIIDGDRRQIENKKPVVQGEEVTEADTYNGDIYTKGAFFMHSLRFLVGDSVFFPTLKHLATDPSSTYDHMITTDYVEKLFSNAAHKNLKPFFDFYLRTTHVFDFLVQETGFHQYRIAQKNYFMDIPLEVGIGNQTNRMVLGKQGILLKSDYPPRIDEKSFYLKTVTWE